MLSKKIPKLLIEQASFTLSSAPQSVSEAQTAA